MAITPNAQSPGMEAAGSEPRAGSLADVLDVILDKGIVIDAFVRVSLVGIEILTLDARIVVASVETYMHFAREANRLEMGGGGGSLKQGLGGMMGNLAEGGAHNIARGALQGAGEGLREGLLPGKKEPQDRREGGIVQRAISSVKEKATDSIRDALSPDNGEDDNKQTAERAQAEHSGASAPTASPEPRRSRRRQPAGQGGQTGQGRSGAGSSRRAAPATRRAPPRDPED